VQTKRAPLQIAAFKATPHIAAEMLPGRAGNRPIEAAAISSKGPPMEALFVPLALGAGAILPLQAGANAQLAKAAGSPFAATTMQLSIAALALLFLAWLAGEIVALTALPNAPWWHMIGGAASALYVIATILLFPRLGAVVSVGLLIAGQMLASLALDVFGLLGVAAKGASLGSLAGNAAVLLGAALIVIGQRGATQDLNVSKAWWIAFALAAGAVLPVQGALNGLLRQDLGEPFAVGAFSFIVATLTMVGVMAIRAALAESGPLHFSGVSSLPWWGWLGGFVGATYVTTVFTAIPAIGAAAVIGLTVAGQQVASIFVDLFGWFRLPKRAVSATRLIGVVVLLAGVALIELA
jgi:transporter family-2 protein